MSRSVQVVENGRSGSIVYAEAGQQLSFWWEFGGNECVALVRVGDEAEWRTRHGWALPRRAEILRHVADELIRQKAPGCLAEIDDAGGWIALKKEASAAATAPADRSVKATGAPRRAFDVGAWRSLRERTATVVLLLAVLAGGLLWIKQRVLVIDPGKGSPLGPTVRTATHLATFIQTLVPYTPRLDRGPGEDRYRLSLFLVPLDGSAPRLVALPPDTPPTAFGLARILGGDQRTLWFDVGGIGGIDLRSHELLPPGRLPPPPAQSGAWRPAPSVGGLLVAGFVTPPGRWLGLHSDAELVGDFAPGKWLRRVEPAEDARQPRRFHRGVLEPGDDGKHWRVRSMTALQPAVYVNAAFLREREGEPPLGLREPDGALLIFSTDEDARATLVVARTDLEGRLAWKVDTGIDRFSLQQMLPGPGSVGFVGPRPPIPGKVSEPLLVIVDVATGQATAHSLWR